MPAVGGTMAAIIAGWAIDSVLGPFLGTGPELVVSFLGSTVVFFLMRNWLKALRDG